MVPDKTPVAILGAGPVGTAMAGALHDAGFPLAAVWSRSAERAAKAAKAVKNKKSIPTPATAAEAAREAKLVLFAVPDKAIAGLAGEVASAGGFQEGCLAVHCSGSQPSSVLEPAHLRGGLIGSIHPMKSFAGSDQDRNFKGVFFGVEGDSKAVAELEDLVMHLGGIALILGTEDKRMYHAASAVVSNFTVTLFHLGLKMLEGIGVPRKTAQPALAALLKGTCDNVVALGVPKALTGPIARGDIETVAAHLEALKAKDPALLPLYAQLARHSVDVAIEKGTLAREDAEVIRSMLARYG
jgi:predicted short-subunit dehydrogenase-like oxidoreductase (DUF2520 family)